MKQKDLFKKEEKHDIYDALAALVNVLGGAKTVGTTLWPEKAVATATSRADACTNPNKKEKFAPEELVRLFLGARGKNFHDSKNLFDYLVGYHPSAPISLQEEKEDLMRDIRRVQDELSADYKHLARIEQREKGDW